MVFSLAKERDNRCRSTIEKPAGCGACTTVVKNSRNALEKPFMRAVAQKKDSGMIIAFEA